jgi:hypothetical protein
MTSVLKRERRIKFETQERKKMEADFRLMLPPTKECEEPMEAGTGKEDFTPRAFQRNDRPAVILISDFWSPEL